MRQRGFTLIELLVTILIIGILAAVGMAAYNGHRKKAHTAVAISELRDLETAIYAARVNEDKNLQDIISHGWTGGACDQSATFPADLPQTHACWTQYLSAVTAIEQASGMNLSHVRDGDPSGAPYYIDANDGHVAPSCFEDFIGFFVSGGKLQGLTSLRGWTYWATGATGTSPQREMTKRIKKYRTDEC